jgi:hypothetical protein
VVVLGGNTIEKYVEGNFEKMYACVCVSISVTRQSCFLRSRRCRKLAEVLKLDSGLPWKVKMSDRGIRAVSHKFRIGQSVEFFPGRGVDHRSKGQYTVVLLRPLEGDAPQYRIRNKVDGHERIVGEHELGLR